MITSHIPSQLPAARRPAISPIVNGKDTASLLAGMLFCGLVVTAFAISDRNFIHWFIVPVFVSGVIVSIDAIDWIRGRFELFDPAGIIGVFGVHFFFLAPLLHVKYDYWMRWVEVPEDWRYWLGIMAVFNLIGLCVYRGARSVTICLRDHASPKRVWVLEPATFRKALTVAILFSAALQVLVYFMFGGVGGYVSTFDEGEGAFAGFGLIFTLSESFPILITFSYVVFLSKRPQSRTWFAIGAVLLMLFVLSLLFGGLRGSRNNTVWDMFWAVGLIHLWVRPIPKKLLLGGFTVFLVFMYLYGFYKSYGTDGLEAFGNSDVRAEMTQSSNRSFETVILGDLGRADVQALLLSRLLQEPVPVDFSYAFGRTYAGAIALLIPGAIWPEKPSTKVEEGTDILYGEGSYASGREPSTRVYGLAGEAVLNFGPLAIPGAFVLLGLVVGSVRRWIRGLDNRDGRLLLVPYAVATCVLMIGMDSDNLVFSTFKNALVPGLVVLLGSHRQSIESDSP